MSVSTSVSASAAQSLNNIMGIAASNQCYLECFEDTVATQQAFMSPASDTAGWSADQWGVLCPLFVKESADFTACTTTTPLNCTTPALTTSAQAAYNSALSACLPSTTSATGTTTALKTTTKVAGASTTAATGVPLSVFTSKPVVATAAQTATKSSGAGKSMNAAASPVLTFLTVLVAIYLL
ncbi:hypothetical protein HK101_008565 [Irineochytrium annulatum]|nr:hypothetical protein HK101_008565 [Irineochytrium annulatum]